MLALATAAHAEAPFDLDQTPGKLPKIVTPQAYRIEIKPDMTALTLTGHETINIQVRQPTDTIVLNQAGLNLSSARTESGAAAVITEDQAAQTASLRFAAPLTVGAHTLTIDYAGPILATPNGIYYDDYKTADGAAKRMLVTQFEVADARRMFPGWDEPAFKATFQLTATLPKTYAAVSNMPIVGTTPVGDDAQRVSFAPSPRMSTYLLALVAGDMTAVHGEAAGTQMNAWAPTGRQDQAAYALQVEEQVLPYYNAYFGVAYPLPKLDLIAIPGNYEAGAMENWGAITFIDDAMLFDPKTSAPSTREEIYLVVAHEMAHQWSGDLVTMGWWDNIWLNEGFATWMETKANDHFNPQWEIWPRQHATHELAMAQDALPTTHPIQQPIRDESEANSAFDGISYEKGSAVIRMIEQWIGPDAFRAGMRGYMKAHAYHNATSADLWAALSAAAGRDVTPVAASFTEQPGVPLVEVARTCVGGQAQITLTQARFALHDPNAKAETWTIPIAYGAPGGAAQHTLLTGAPLSLAIGACDQPIKINLGEDGYYRTQYDAASLAALGKVLPTLAPVDRANLLGDQFALYGAGRAPLADYLNLLPVLKDERDIAVWTDTLSHLTQLHTALVGTPQQAPFDAFAIRLVRAEFDRLGWDAKPGESVLDTMLRPDLIAALGRFGDQAVIAEAGRRFQAFRADPATLPPALREPVLNIVGHNADQAAYDALRQMGIAAVSTEEKLRYFGAMAGAADPALIKQTVAFASAGQLPGGRIDQFLKRASVGSENPDLVFALVGQQEAVIAPLIPADGLGPTALTASAAGSSNPNTAKALMAAASSNASRGAHTLAARTADGIDAAAGLRARTAPAVAAWLAQTNMR